MILYSGSASDFRKSADSNRIAREIEDAYVRTMRRRPNPGERMAWSNSMQFMESVVRNARVADDCGVLIEYNIPSTSKRIDFIIAGKDEADCDNFVIIELKQWSAAEASSKDGVVVTFVGRGNREVAHPSYQAWSYRQFLADMNEAIYAGGISGYSCAYLHNYRERDPEPLKAPQYDEVVRRAPLFLADDAQRLQQFLHRHVGRGQGMEFLYKIKHGRIRPSKRLIDHVDGLFQGNSEFILLDEQKVAYETIMTHARSLDGKKTIIVRGGPGTGKSVISVNAFGGLLREELNTIFVAPNASFRNVMVTMLAGDGLSKARLKNLFQSSGRLHDEQRNRFDVVVVDEAHRLKRRGAFGYRGENQVEDIIRASFINVFFIDDAQRVRPEDLGSVAEIKRVARQEGSQVTELDLVAQFRCSGSEGYVNWLDDVLQIRETGNFDGWDDETFEFRILDSPGEVLRRIRTRVDAGYRARVLAGYAWPWTAAKEGNPDGEVLDVTMEEHDFAMPWNAHSIRETWAIEESGVGQVGCIHTAQGLEFDYVGVIIGHDLRYDPETMEIFADYAEYYDRVGKRGLRENNRELTGLVKNIYRVLMSRGMKGCYVFVRDENLRTYLRQRLEFAVDGDATGTSPESTDLGSSGSGGHDSMR